MDLLNYEGLYREPVRGDGTYYTPKFPGAGHCILHTPVPRNMQGMLTVAMNKNQYSGSKTCGMCIELTGHGEGKGWKPINGTRVAMVNNGCPGCEWGSVDLDEDGGGRWEVEWIAVECPTQGENLVYKFRGGNAHFQKLQIRNHPYPIKSVAFFQEGRERKLKRTEDNHFVTKDTGVIEPIQVPIRVVIIDVFGQRVEDVIEEYVRDVEIPGNVQFPLSINFDKK